MSAYPYPGGDLSLSQLLDALNRKLEHNISTASSEELEVLEASALNVLSGIRALKNASCPVNRLHPECLAFVFRLVANEVVCYYGEYELGSWKGPYSWIAVTHVCRYWRNIALTFPSIWTLINTYCPAMARLSITRSKSALLVIGLMEHDTEDWFIALQPHIGRFGQLQITLDSRIYPLIVKYFANADSPHVTLIRLIVEPVADPEFHPQFPPLFRSQFPSLRALVVSGFALTSPEVSRIAVNLAYLELRHDEGPDGLNVGQLLDVLEANAELEDLIVSSVAPNEEPGNIHRLVKLNKLCALGLARCAAQTILRHLQLPPITDVIIHHAEIGEGESILQKTLPTSLNSLENFMGLTTAGFRRLSPDIFTLVAYRGKVGSIAIRARIPSALHLVQAFMPSFQPLAVDHLRELWLDDQTEMGDGKLTDLGTLISSLPVLETLVLLGCKCDGIFSGLQPGDELIPCPSLTTLTIHDKNFPSYPALLDLAIKRNDNGVPFKNVTITCHPGNSFASEGLILLRNYVETVKYEVDEKAPRWPCIDVVEYP